MNQRTQKTTSSPDRRVDVLVTEDPDGRRQVLVRDLSLGQGIGWYVQKSIRLDPDQVDALMGALCCAKQGCGNTQPRHPARILQMDARKWA